MSDRAPVRIVDHGDPDDPFPIPASRPKQERLDQHVPDPLPIADRAVIVDKIVTRRLVVVDDQNRERLVAEQNQFGELTLRITSPRNDAAVTIIVGDAHMGEPSAYLTVSSRGGSVSLDANPASTDLEIEKLVVDAPTLRLHNEGLELHRYHYRDMFAGDEPLLDPPEAQVNQLLEKLGLQNQKDDTQPD